MLHGEGEEPSGPTFLDRGSLWQGHLAAVGRASWPPTDPRVLSGRSWGRLMALWVGSSGRTGTERGVLLPPGGLHPSGYGLL